MLNEEGTEQNPTDPVAEALSAARVGFDYLRGELAGVLELVESLDELVTGDRFGPVIGRG